MSGRGPCSKCGAPGASGEPAECDECFEKRWAKDPANPAWRCPDCGKPRIGVPDREQCQCWKQRVTFGEPTDDQMQLAFEGDDELC